MVLITPGIALLGRLLQKLCFAASALISVKYLSARLYGVHLHAWLLICASLVLGPLLLAAKVQLREIRKRREAAAMGARMAPMVKGKRIGNVDVLTMMVKSFESGYPGDGQRDFIKEHGSTFNVRCLWEDVIFTVDPECIKIILATDFNNYIKGSKFFDAMKSVLGSGVFNSDGDMWKFHRSMTRPFFSRDRISDFDLFDRHADKLIALLKERARSGYPVDLQDAFSRFTLDTATEFLFGTCVHSLDAGLPYPRNAAVPAASTHQTDHPSEAFARAFLEAQEHISFRARLGHPWPLFEVFGSKTDRPMEVVNAFLDPVLERAIEKQRLSGGVGNGVEEKEKNVVEEGETLLDHLVKFTSDPKLLKDETLNILIAGRDTTAATLAFVMYALSMYPLIFARLREEVLAHVGPTRRPTFDDIREMKYLRAVINETLRLFPVVPFNVRESIKATTWPSEDPLKKPIYIPAGTGVPYSVFLMHRRTDLWGPDAEEFDPDRFLDARLKKYLTKNPFIFVPFNAGPRICLGQQFAYNEMSFTLIRLAQHFAGTALALDAQPADSRPPAEWASTPGRKGIERCWPKSHLTMYAHGGMWVNLTEDKEKA